MPSKADLSGTTLPRRQLGRALRDARHAQGVTLEQVARDTEFSRATLSRIELGQYDRIRFAKSSTSAATTVCRRSVRSI